MDILEEFWYGNINLAKRPNAKQVFFENREIGMEEILKLVSKGYKIG